MDTYGTFCAGSPNEVAWMWIADISLFFFVTVYSRVEPVIAEKTFLLASTKQKCLQKRQKSVLLNPMVLTWL
jgi:hypothetical protein